MEQQVADLVHRFGLQPHPEGGWFAELHRGEDTVVHSDGRVRATGTLIYYLLEKGQVSRWHIVASDEYWIFIDGSPLHLYQAASGTLAVTELGTPSTGYAGAEVVKANTWQAAQAQTGWSLVSCCVAPGFDFADFRLIPDEGTDREALSRLSAPVELLGSGRSLS